MIEHKNALPSQFSEQGSGLPALDDSQSLSQLATPRLRRRTPWGALFTASVGTLLGSLQLEGAEPPQKPNKPIATRGFSGADHPSASSQPSDGEKGAVVEGLPEVYPGIQLEAWLNTDRALGLTEDILGRVVLIDFWSTTCAPCLERIPIINNLEAKYGGKGLLVLSVTDESAKTVLKFLQKREPKDRPNTIIGTKAGALSLMFNVKPIPTVVILRPDGSTAFNEVATKPGSEKRIEEEIVDLLQTVDPRFAGSPKKIGKAVGVDPELLKVLTAPSMKGGEQSDAAFQSVWDGLKKKIQETKDGNIAQIDIKDIEKFLAFYWNSIPTNSNGADPAKIPDAEEDRRSLCNFRCEALFAHPKLGADVKRLVFDDMLRRVSGSEPSSAVRESAVDALRHMLRNASKEQREKASEGFKARLLVEKAPRVIWHLEQAIELIEKFNHPHDQVPESSSSPLIQAVAKISPNPEQEPSTEVGKKFREFQEQCWERFSENGVTPSSLKEMFRDAFGIGNPDGPKQGPLDELTLLKRWEVLNILNRIKDGAYLTSDVTYCIQKNLVLAAVDSLNSQGGDWFLNSCLCETIAKYGLPASDGRVSRTKETKNALDSLSAILESLDKKTRGSASLPNNGTDGGVSQEDVSREPRVVYWNRRLVALMLKSQGF